MPNESNLEMLVAKGESQTLEFKRSLSIQREGLEGLCAMVNSDTAHGRIFFGIAPNGDICGIEHGNLDKAQRSISQTIRDKFDPPLIVEINIEEMTGRQVLVVSADRARNIPYHEYDGRAWIREGTTNRKLTFAEKDQLRRMRNRDFHPGPWKCNQCGGQVGHLEGFIYTDEGLKRSYLCECGGEFEPITFAGSS
jgi:ATP-dependent DNA helicase RecG